MRAHQKKNTTGLTGALESGILIIAIACGGLIGCGDDNDEDNNNPRALGDECERNSQCVDNGWCRDWDDNEETPTTCDVECADDRDCSVGTACEGGLCAIQCRLPSDCGDGLYCGDNGRCTYQCRTHFDCAENEHGKMQCDTLHGMCVEPLAEEPPDAGVNTDADIE